jgi:hypothetical protein
MSHIAPYSQHKVNVAKSRNFWGSFPYLITLAFSSFYFLNAARLDPEPHHDGYLLATAIAARDGLLPHLEVFNQYGPITSYVLALPLKLNFGPLLTIRLTTAVLLILICLLLVSISSILGRPIAGVIGVVVWSSTSPDWTITTASYSFVGEWPWPNVIFTFFALLSLSLFLRGSFSQKNFKYSKNFYPTLISSGLFLSIAVFTRVTIGVVYGAGMLGLVLLGMYKRLLTRGQISAFILGLATGLTTFIFTLSYLHIAETYLVDTVIGPASATSPASPLSFLWLVVRPTIGAVTAIFFIWIFYKVLQRYKVGEALALTMIATTVTSFMFATHQWLEFSNILPRKFFVPWGKDGLYNAQLNLPLYFALLISPCVVIYLFIRVFQSPKISQINQKDIALPSDMHQLENFKHLSIGVVAACLLLGSYPIGDLLHIWWSTPLALVLLVIQISNISFFRQNARAFSVAVLLPFVVVGTTHLIKQNNVSRNELSSPALDGMLVSKNYYYAYVSTDSFMKKHSDKDILFMCDDGMFSVWNNYWQSAGPDFVSWSWGQRTPIRSKVTGKVRPVIFCANDTHETSVLARSMGLTITDQARYPLPSRSGNQLKLSSFSSQYLYFAEYMGIPGSKPDLYDHPS